MVSGGFVVVSPCLGIVSACSTAGVSDDRPSSWIFSAVSNGGASMIRWKRGPGGGRLFRASSVARVKASFVHGKRFFLPFCSLMCSTCPGVKPNQVPTLAGSVANNEINDNQMMTSPLPICKSELPVGADISA